MGFMELSRRAKDWYDPKTFVRSLVLVQGPRQGQKLFFLVSIVSRPSPEATCMFTPLNPGPPFLRANRLPRLMPGNIDPADTMAEHSRFQGFRFTGMANVHNSWSAVRGHNVVRTCGSTPVFLSFPASCMRRYKGVSGRGRESPTHGLSPDLTGRRRNKSLSRETSGFRAPLGTNEPHPCPGSRTRSVNVHNAKNPCKRPRNMRRCERPMCQDLGDGPEFR